VRWPSGLEPIAKCRWFVAQDVARRNASGIHADPVCFPAPLLSLIFFCHMSAANHDRERVESATMSERRGWPDLRILVDDRRRRAP